MGVNYCLSIQLIDDCIGQEPVGGNNRIDENMKLYKKTKSDCNENTKTINGELVPELCP